MNADESARLLESNAMLRRFAGQAAHDLQEPLRLLSGYLDLLCLHEDGKARINASKLAHDAKDTSDRMQRLVASLLAYARLEAEAPREEPVPLALALGDAVANLHRRVQETRAQITHGSLPTIQGDRGNLARLLQNLVENSLKYADERPPVVHVHATRDAEGWAITVDDNGPGFPTKGRERLFEPFARLHGASTPGAGLGLAAAREIVRQHHGTIAALDAPSGGARILIRIPERAR